MALNECVCKVKRLTETVDMDNIRVRPRLCNNQRLCIALVAKHPKDSRMSVRQGMFPDCLPPVVDNAVGQRRDDDPVGCSIAI